MKKILMSFLVASSLAGAVTSHADIQILWQGSAGFWIPSIAGPPVDPNEYILFPAVNPAGNTLAQLIWSPTAVIDPADASTPGNVTGDDILLASFTVNNVPYADYGAGSAVYSNSVYGQTLEAGFIYARIYQDSTVNQGDYYFAGNAVSSVPYAFTGLESPVTYEHTVNGTLGDQLNLQVIPEPATMALLGISSCLVMLRRRMHRAA